VSLLFSTWSTSVYESSHTTLVTLPVGRQKIASYCLDLQLLAPRKPPFLNMVHLGIPVHLHHPGHPSGRSSEDNQLLFGPTVLAPCEPPLPNMVHLCVRVLLHHPGHPSGRSNNQLLLSVNTYHPHVNVSSLY
jgi:hypothetical protein